MKVWWDDPEEDQTIWRWENGKGMALNSSEVAGELNRLQRDSERLEWLVENQCYPMPTKSGWCLAEEGCSCSPETNAKSWRDAIDEAMKTMTGLEEE
jgi:hypothetical protein